MMKYMLLSALLVAGCAASDDRVKLDLFFEGLCPGCHQFILQQLYPTWNKIGDIMDLGLYAYGNAETHRTKNGSVSFECQHGPEECVVNMMITCFEGQTKDTKEILDFVHCVVHSNDPVNAGKQCASGSSVAWEKVNTCMHSSEGVELELAVAKATPADHEWVPWPVLNGKYCDDCLDDLLTQVCDAYTGKTKPAACQTRCYKD